MIIATDLINVSEIEPTNVATYIPWSVIEQFIVNIKIKYT